MLVELYSFSSHRVSVHLLAVNMSMLPDVARWNT